MFTHEEIRQITFEKAMRGYRAEDVESFMEKIADEFEALEKKLQHNLSKDLETFRPQITTLLQSE
ncbi:MAG: DivIVA domain-containing protein, partial [Oscillospiraceae bacterium]